MKLLIISFVVVTFFTNYILAKIDKKEFCLHNYNGISKIVNPFYVNAKNETIYFDTIEEYSKYIGPTWFGVSYCGNNTVVNNVGRYFTYVGDDKIIKSSDDYKVNSDKITKVNDQNNDKNKDNSKKKASKVKRYMNFVYQKNENVDPKEPLKCIPLNSVNPAYNPYHPLLIKTSNSNRANVINNMGTSYGGNTNNIMQNINNTPEEDGKVQQCGIVYNMKDSSISCSVRISNTIDESVKLSTSSSDSKSLSFSESGTFSNSSERILTYTEGKVTSVTDSDEDTHSDTHESSYAYTESEEHSHARTDGGEIVDETNW
eukprot:jgi/Orpsp1_1/1180844/evm.model.c7180000074843.1